MDLERESNIVAVWGYSIAPLQMTLMLAIDISSIVIALN